MQAECEVTLDRCTVYDTSCGGIDYDVEVDDDSSCWDARLAEDRSSEVPDPRPPRSAAA